MALNVVFVDTDGSGAGTGTTTFPKSGTLHGIKIIHNAGTHTGTDVTISEQGGLQRTLLEVTDVADGAYYNPQDEIDTTAGVGTTTYEPFVLSGTRILVTVAQGPTSTENALKVLVNIGGDV